MNTKVSFAEDLESQLTNTCGRQAHSLQSISPTDFPAEASSQAALISMNQLDSDESRLPKIVADSEAIDIDNTNDSSIIIDDAPAVDTHLFSADSSTFNGEAITIGQQSSDYAPQTNYDEEYDYDYEYVTNPVERVEAISTNKMDNLRSLLMLNMVGHIFGFLTQVNAISYFMIFALIFLGTAIMLARAISEKEESNETYANQIKNKLFKVSNWACLSLYFFIVLLKSSGYVTVLSPWTIPGCLCIFMESFFLASSFTSGEKGVEISLKYAVWVQLFLISLKIDGAAIPWSFTLFVFICFGFVSLMVALILLVICISTIMGCPCYLATGKTAIMGSAWYFLIALTNVGWGAVTLTIEKNLSNGTDARFALGALFMCGAVFSLAMIIATRAFHSILFLFLKHEALHDLQEAGEFTGVSSHMLAASDEVPRFQYLAKVTNTYFSTIQKSLQIKDQTVLNKWNKDIKRAKFYKFLAKRKARVCPKSSARLSPLKQRGNRMYKRSKSLDLDTERSVALREIVKIHPEYREEEAFSPDMELKRHRVVYSFDDKDVMKKVKRPVDEGIHEDKEMCFVCYEAEANAVVMDCGHGGICYNCAIKSWERSDKCHMCRGDIKSILKVLNLPIIKLVKVIDETEKIVERDDIIA